MGLERIPPCFGTAHSGVVLRPAANQALARPGN